MDDFLEERYELAKLRIAQIVTEEAAAEPFRDFFQKTAAFLEKTIQVMDADNSDLSLDDLQKQNHSLYEDILEENYDTSYGNPAYAAKMLGEYGKDFSFLYAELRGAIAYASEHDLWNMTVVLELFLEVYAAFAEEEVTPHGNFPSEVPKEKIVRDIHSSNEKE